MEISLIRHGRSKWVQNDWITFKQFEDWVTRYDDHGVYAEETYPKETKKNWQQPLWSIQVIYIGLGSLQNY
jgi:Cu2+-containing amine oxidase